ncbi:MAG: phosphoribosyltransferase [Caulobacter sp.]|nr:phosphoribosyltransferase [Caulobacter sp.]
MHYRSIADLNATITRNLRQIPHDIDLVVGIPRSGLIPANMISLALNLPLADFEGFLQGRILAKGRTRALNSLTMEPGRPRKVLVVDDSINSGGSMLEARQKLAAAGLEDAAVFCAVYGLRDAHPEADLVLETVPRPRMFQWNLMHHKFLADACLDIDGVLCVDPSDDENDDGPGYEAFLSNARPFLRPTQKVGHLVTSRLEKYRGATQAWLAAAGIDYGKLWMLDLPDAKARRRLGAHGRFKAGVYAELDATLFIESEERQAVEIARLSRKPVLSIETQTILYPDQLEDQVRMRERQIARDRLRLSVERPPRTGLKQVARRLLGPSLYGALGRAAGRQGA